jgi:chromosome segregation ATPase
MSGFRAGLGSTLFLCAALSSPFGLDAIAADGPQEIARSIRADISAQTNDLLELKTDMRRSFDTLHENILRARQDADRWEQTARQEHDPDMQTVQLGFRDDDRSHGESLAAFEGLLIDAAQIGERLESDLNLLESNQGNLDSIAQNADKSRPKSTQILDALKLLELLQNDLVVSAKLLVALKTTISSHADTLKEYERKVQELLAGLGSPHDQLKRWQRELVRSTLSQNRIQAQHLAIIATDGARLSDILGKMGSTQRSQLNYLDAVR